MERKQTVIDQIRYLLQEKFNGSITPVMIDSESLIYSELNDKIITVAEYTLGGVCLDSHINGYCVGVERIDYQKLKLKQLKYILKSLDNYDDNC